MQRQESTRIISWNINSDTRVDTNAAEKNQYTAIAFPECSWQRRLPDVTNTLDYLIKQKRVTIFALQEVGDDMMPELTAYLCQQNFVVLTNRYNQSKCAFNFITAYDRTQYIHSEMKQIYLTKTGIATDYTANENEKVPSKLNKLKKIQREQNLGQPFEKSAQLITLKQLESDRSFVVANTHLGMTNSHKIKAVNSLCSQLAAITLPLIVAGDFNQFDDQELDSMIHKPQIEAMQSYGFTWASECIAAQEPCSTFVAYPYDIDRFLTDAEDKSELERLKTEMNPADIRRFYLRKIAEGNRQMLVATTLDGVFNKNFEAHACRVTSCKAILFSSSRRLKPAPDAKTLQQLVISASNKGETLLPSDHLPVLTKIIL